MASNSRSKETGLIHCPVCYCERYHDERDSCCCADCRDIMRRMTALEFGLVNRNHWKPEDLPLEEYADRHARLLAITRRIEAEMKFAEASPEPTMLP